MLRSVKWLPVLALVLATRLAVTDAQVPVQALWARQSPGVLTPDYSGPVQLTVAYRGNVAALRTFYTGATGYVFDEFPRVETTTLEGSQVSVFRPTWSMSDFVLRFGNAIDFDSGTAAGMFMAPSSVPLSGGFPQEYASLSVRGMSRHVGSVPVTQIDGTAQYSSHVINLVIPGMAGTLGPAGSQFSTSAVAQRLYSYLGDDYDLLGYVFQEPPLMGSLVATHEQVRNPIGGIGLGIFDGTAAFGSAGRLWGVDRYYHTLNNGISNHETLHQWGDYFDWPALAGITYSDHGHTPLSANDSTPIPHGIFPADRIVAGVAPGTWTVQRAPEPTRTTPLLAYAMGRLPAAQVPPTIVFNDQTRFARTGTTFTDTTHVVTIDQIVARHGVRTGPVVSSLRRATVLISRDQLASQREMDYWTFYTQRLEDPNHTGVIDENGIGSFEALTGVPLHTALVTPQPLTGHAVVEPTTLHPGDLTGVVLDAPLPLTLATSGVVRIAGRIVGPAFAAATGVSAFYGISGVVTLQSPVAADGTFEITGPHNRTTAGRTPLSLSLRFGNTSRSLSRVSNIRFVNIAAPPARPVALRATASGRTVTLRWSPDTGTAVSNYVVDVGSSPGAANVGSFATVGTVLTASGVPDGRYYIRVRGVNASGSSAPSTEAALVVGCLPPDAPGPLTGGVTGTVVTLNWAPSPTPGVRYVVMAGSASQRSDIAQVNVGSTTSLHAQVPPGRYFVRIRAVSACGTFADSNEISLPVGLPAPPGAPGTLTATVAGNVVSLMWGAASGGVGSYVLEAGSAPGLANLATLPVGASTSYVVPGVPAGRYYVRVRATNAGGAGPASNEREIVVP